jgi:catechol 2,3-dioxygenase-like lactoylglutathione lyase family enzyme
LLTTGEQGLPSEPEIEGEVIMNVPRPTAESAVNVTRLGYVAFETPDVDRLVEYYTRILDFTVVDRSPEGAFVTTGFDHHCVVITRAAAAKGRTATGYEISEPLDDAERRLRDAGYEVERRTDIGPGTPDVLVLAEPTTGIPMHLMTAQEPGGAWPTMLRPTKLGHVASFTPIGALGLIVPQATGIAELLTPLAASGLIAFQVVAFAVHARRKQYSNLPVNVIFAAAALFVAAGRFLPWH